MSYIGTRRALMGAGSRYYKKVLALGPIAYWPLWEPSGSVAYDISGNGRNGAYTGVTLGQAGIGDGRTSASFDGATSYCNVYSAGLASAFNGAEGTIAGWARVSEAGVWTDGTQRAIAYLQADADNFVVIIRSSTNNRVSFWYDAAGTFEAVNLGGLSTTGWMHLAITWSAAADQVKAYYNGVQTGATATGLGTWAGALASGFCNIGAYHTTPLQVFSGTGAHWTIFTRPLAATDIASLATV